MERIHSIAELQNQCGIDYTERTLHMLDGLQLSFWIRELLEEVLAWSETAKGGSLNSAGRGSSRALTCSYIILARLSSINCISSSQENGLETSTSPKQEIIRILISTHGLVGQYIRVKFRMQKMHRCVI